MHLIPFQRNRRFVGRASVIDKLKAELFANDGEGPRQISLAGLGGTGKTQVALYLAYWVKENRPEWSVFWVPAISMASFEQAYRDIARLLDLSGADDNTTTKLVQRYLDSDESGRWLLIIDNIDEEQIASGEEQGILDFLPRNDRGRILFTTRVRRIAVRLTQSDVTYLSQMNRSEAYELLRKSLVDGELLIDRTGVAELLEILTYLPLAIVQAAAYLNETMASVSEYIWLLQNTERDMAELLETEFADNTRYPEVQNAVGSTLAVSFDQIRKNKEAAMLLSFIAHVEFKAIPRSMLPAVGSEQMMTRAVGVLRGYSFLSIREDGETYDMHRLVHLSSRVWVARQGDADQQRRAVLLHLRNIFSTSEREERERWRPLLPHALKAIEVNKKDNNWGEEESQIGFWVGRCLMGEGRYREAVEVLEQVVAVCDTTLAETDDRRLASQHDLGRAYQFNGQMREAIDLLERVVAIHKETLPEAHPEQLLISQHNLARAYHAGGRMEEAIGILQRVVATRKKTQAETHPGLLESQSTLAMVYHTSGRMEEAIDLLDWVAVMRKKTLPETHRDRLGSQQNLAIAYYIGGRAKEAIDLLNWVVAIHEKTLAEVHPDRLSSEQALARAYMEDGQTKKAIDLLERVVAIYKKTQAEMYRDRLGSQHNLAVAYYNDGQVDKAIELLQIVVILRRRVLPEEHPDRLDSEWWLGLALDDKEREDGCLKREPEGFS